MNDTDPLSKCKNVIPQILQHLNIECVVCVDDCYLETPELAQVIVDCENIDKESLLSIFPQLVDKSIDDSDLRKQAIGKLWEVLPPKERKICAAKVQAAIKKRGDVFEKELLAADRLRTLFEGVNFQTFSPEEWQKESGALLNGLKTGRALILFDRDLSLSEGTSKDGMNYIVNVLKSPLREKVICTLYTATISPEEEEGQWGMLCESHALEREQFTVISKKNIEESPDELVFLLKVTALLPHFKELKETTRLIIHDTSKAADEALDAIHVFDFEQIVFNSVEMDGGWELDQLFRLHSIFRGLEHGKHYEKVLGMEKAANQFRKVRGFPISSNRARPSRRVQEIQQSELYRTAESINQIYSPLELGDMFECSTPAGSIRRFVLMMQPCDLMIRHTGKRSPELERLITAPIDDDDSPGDLTADLPHFDLASGTRRSIRVKYGYLVLCSADALDLCAFNPSGSSFFKFDSEAPHYLRPSLANRFCILRNKIQKKIKSLQEFDSNPADTPEVKAIKKRARELAKRLLFCEAPFSNAKYDPGQKSLDFGCRRTGRLERSMAFDLLGKISEAQRRLAFEVDLTESQNRVTGEGNHEADSSVQEESPRQ